MTKTKLEVVEQYFETFNGGYFRSMLDLLDDNVVHDTNLLQGEQGKKAYEAFLNRQNECYQERIHDIVIMTNEQSKNAAAEYYVTGTYRKTEPGQPPARGQVYTIRCGVFFEFSGERISRVTTYYNLQEWLDKVR